MSNAGQATKKDRWQRRTDAAAAAAPPPAAATAAAASSNSNSNRSNSNNNNNRNNRDSDRNSGRKNSRNSNSQHSSKHGQERNYVLQNQTVLLQLGAKRQRSGGIQPGRLGFSSAKLSKQKQLQLSYRLVLSL